MRAVICWVQWDGLLSKFVFFMGFLRSFLNFSGFSLAICGISWDARWKNLILMGFCSFSFKLGFMFILIHQVFDYLLLRDNLLRDLILVVSEWSQCTGCGFENVVMDLNQNFWTNCEGSSTLPLAPQSGRWVGLVILLSRWFIGFMVMVFFAVGRVREGREFEPWELSFRGQYSHEA